MTTRKKLIRFGGAAGAALIVSTLTACGNTSPDSASAGSSPCRASYRSFLDLAAAVNEQKPGTVRTETGSPLQNQYIEIFDSIPDGGQQRFLTHVCDDLDTGEYTTSQERLDVLKSDAAQNLNLGMMMCQLDTSAPVANRTAAREVAKEVPNYNAQPGMQMDLMIRYWALRDLCPM